MSASIHHWKPGAKVVCLDDRFPPIAIPRFTRLPIRGRIYTLSGVAVRPHWRTGEKLWSVTLLECPSVNGERFGLHLHRFRLLADHLAVSRHHNRAKSARRMTPHEQASTIAQPPSHGAARLEAGPQV